MLSIVTYSRTPRPNSVQERNVAKTVGTACEYQVIDGSAGERRFAAAYNWAATRVKGDIVAFIADDLYFLKRDWGAVLEQKFADDPDLGIVGLIGTQYLFSDKASLTAAGRPFIKGRLVYHLQNGDFFITLFSPEKGDAEVVACDGSFLAVRASVLQKTPFDDSTFPGSHFYDLDFCLRAWHGTKIHVTTDILAKRMAAPVYDDAWRAAGAAFLTKHHGGLPASCVPTVPDPGAFSPLQIVDLTGRLSKETIC